MVRGYTATQNPILAGFNTAQQHFIQLWSEMFASYSIDSYQVPLCNSRIVLAEVAEVAEAVARGECDEANLEAVRREALSLVNADPVFGVELRLERNPLLKALGFSGGHREAADAGPAGQAKPGKVRALAHTCHSVVSRAMGKYLDAILNGLSEAFATNDGESVWGYTRALGSEAIARGRCPESMAALGREFIRHGEMRFEERFARFISGLQNADTSWTCYFRVTPDDCPIPGTDLEGLDARPLPASEVERRVAKVSKPLASSLWRKSTYLAVRATAPAPWEAAHAGWRQVESRLDMVHMSRPRAWDIRPEAVVVGDGNGPAVSTTVRPEDYHAPPGSAAWVRRLSEALERVDSASAEQIRNALRFYRLALAASSPAPRFLNFWITLEALARTPGSTSVAARIRSVVPALLTRRYPYRLLRNFVEDCLRADVDLDEFSIPASDAKLGTRELLGALQIPQRVMLLRDRLREVPLLGWRLVDYARRFGTGETAAGSLSAHRDRLSWHLQRMYRVRSTIVHSARGAASLPLLNGHLRSYAWSSLAALTHMLPEQGSDHGIDHLLQDVRDGADLQVELLRPYRGPYPPDLVLAPPLSAIMW